MPKAKTKKINVLTLGAGGLLLACCLLAVAVQGGRREAPATARPAATGLQDSRTPTARATRAPVSPTWTPPPTATPTKRPTARPTADLTRAALGYICSGGAQCIKGNGSSKLYHLPGCPSYDQTTPEAVFANEAEAQAAGFKRSGNCK